MAPWQRKIALGAAGALAVAGTITGALVASVPAGAAPPTDDEVRQVLGENAEKLAGGHWRIHLADGSSLLTHGPDPKPDHGTDMNPGDPERPPICAGDYYQQVLYAYPSTNRLATVTAQIRSAVRRMNAVLNEESVASGSRTADFKVLCDGTGQIQLNAFQSSGNSYTNIVNAAKAAGFNKSNVDYTIFYDGSSGACGVGSYYSDERLIVDNNNNKGGGYGISYSGCWDGRTPMHENGHNQGAVQYNSPYSTGSGAHCRDLADVMCYSDGGDRDTGTISRCTDRMHYDCGNDDYFDSAPEAGEYLATNWNIGSPLNRFVVFGTPVNSPPRPSFTYSCPGLTCTFTDTSVDTDGTITARSWNFGDGATSTATNPTHTYAAAGMYTVTLTVTDNSGASASTPGTPITVSTDPDPATPTLTSGQPVTFSLADGAETFYKINVPGGAAQLQVVLDGPSCPLGIFLLCPIDADLYTRFGTRPTATAYACRPFEGDADETCTHTSPTAGYWYVRVHSAGGSGTLTLRATVT